MRFLKPDGQGGFVRQGHYSEDGCMRLSDLLHEQLDYSFLQAKGGQNTAVIHKCRNKHQLAKKIAFDFLELLVDDIIATGNVYVLPVKQGAQIRIVSKSQKEVRAINRRQAYKQVDLLESDFKIYEFVFDFWTFRNGQRKLRRRHIRINQDRYSKLVDKVQNEEMRYFDGFF